MNSVKLAKPDIKYSKQYLEFVINSSVDIQNSGMIHYMPISNESTVNNDINHLIEVEKGIGLPSGWVPASVYWLMEDNSNRILGALNIRHSLTDYLRFRGGHIAYYVHKDERQKGYATEMLRLGLQECTTLGIERVLITCAKGNTGSAKTIVNNGGILDSEDIDIEEVFQRYWIDLSKK